MSRCGTSSARWRDCRCISCSAVVSREGALVYAHANGRDIAETSAEIGRYIDKGFLAVRAQCGVPGVKKAYGISTAGKPYEPAESELPVETVWNTPRYLEVVPKLFEQIRREHGNQVELLHDVHHRLTPIEAARLARELEPYRLFWLEDATPAENQKSFELIRQHSVTPLAVGEVFNSIWDCKHLIENQLIDYIRTTIVHGGGITHLRRLADFAALHHVRTGFPRRHRSFASDHGRSSALRYLGAQLWHPGSTCSTARRTRRCVPARLRVARRTAACGRHTGTRRDPR